MSRYIVKKPCRHWAGAWLVTTLFPGLGAAHADQIDWYGEIQQTVPAAENASAVATESVPVERPDFSGTWVLDKSASDDPKQVMRSARAGRGKPSFRRTRGNAGQRPGARGGPGRGSFGSRPERGGSRRGKSDGGTPIAALSAEQLEIRHADPELVIATDRGGERKFITDYRRSSSISAMGDSDQRVVTAGWEKDVLVIESRSAGGRVVVQRMRLLDQPGRLERVTELPALGRDGSLTEIRQVYALQTP